MNKIINWPHTFKNKPNILYKRKILLNIILHTVFKFYFTLNLVESNLFSTNTI